MSDAEAAPPGVGAKTLALEAVAVWGLFVGYSLLQATVPGVNETHYLSKSRYVWQPAWCVGDVFLESSNPHLVFYRTVGWIASVTDFETAAVVMRLICLAVLAGGWATLSGLVTRRPGVGVLSAAMFLLLSTLGNWSGEWVVGGAESKVPSYGFGLAAVGLLAAGRVPWAGLLAGLSVAFHPVVGAWVTLAMAGAVLLDWRRFRERTGVGGWVAGAVAWVVAAAPGVWPALDALGGTPEESIAAARYQVTRRLAHHLNPARFEPRAYANMLLLLTLGGVFWSLTDEPRRRRLLAAAGAAAVFAVVGVAVGLSGDLATSDWRVFLLKFYPFRSADALVPVAVCVLLADYVADRVGMTGIAAAAFAIAAAAVLIPAHDRDSSRLSASDRADWVRTLTWVRENTPADAVLYATDAQWAVKWYAQREEYANYKDCPQDPASLAEWRRRRGVLFRWSKAALADGAISAEELRSLGEETGITHLVSDRFGPLQPEPCFRAGRFRVTPTGV